MDFFSKFVFYRVASGQKKLSFLFRHAGLSTTIFEIKVKLLKKWIKSGWIFKKNPFPSSSFEIFPGMLDLPEGCVRATFIFD